MEKIRYLEPKEREERLYQSYLSGYLKILKTTEGMDEFLSSAEFSQDEKDYILFNIHQIEKIARMKLLEFRKKVEEFKKEVEGK